MLLPQMGRLGWDPFTEMRRIQDEMNRMFAGFEHRPAAGVFPPVNLWIGNDNIVVTAEVPGVGRGDIDISAREETLTIHCRREPPFDEDKVAWHRRERAYGEFSRTVELPFRVDPENVEARFKNGVLVIVLQRPEAEKPRKIEIRAN